MEKCVSRKMMTRIVNAFVDLVNHASKIIFLTKQRNATGKNGRKTVKTSIYTTLPTALFANMASRLSKENALNIRN